MEDDPLYGAPATQHEQLLTRIEQVLSLADEQNWRGARKINRRGGPNTIFERRIPAMEIGSIGTYAEGGVPAAVYLATNGRLYQWDNWYKYRRLHIQHLEPWELEILVEKLQILDERLRASA